MINETDLIYQSCFLSILTNNILRTMKQIIISLLMALLPMVAMADAVEIDGIYYNLVSKTKNAEVTTNPNEYRGTITIPSTVSYGGTNYDVTSIGNYAFCMCTALSTVNIPSSVIAIGNHAFASCGKIASLTIPNSVKSIGEAAFSGCSGLTSITIPNTLISISRETFYSCSKLASITIPNTVTSIDYQAFWGCSALTSIIIPNSVTSIDYGAFSGCSGLTSVLIGNGTTSIGNYAFMGCRGLTSITIPNSVTSIGKNAFEGCTSLISATIGNSVTSIGSSAFSGCSGLTTLTIPNSVTSIGGGAFSGCSGLTSVTIPNSVTSIDYHAFYECSGLTSVTIGNGIRVINNMAFANCPELKDVYCYADNVPNTYNNAFDGSYIDYATLHVPSSSVNTYRQAEPWKNFKSIVALDGTTPETQKCAKPSITYQNGQLKMNCATEGVQFVTDITDTDIKKHYDAIISLTAAYNVSVYATKTGYENSDISSIILCWIDQTPSISTGTVQVPALPVLIKSEDGWLTIEGADDGTQVTVYTIDGMQAGSAVSHNGTAIVGTNLRTGSVAIVKIGNKSVKVVL